MKCEKLEEVTEELQGVISEDSLFHIILVAVDEKKGGLVMDPDQYMITRLQDSLETLGIEHKLIGEDERGFLDRLLGRKNYLRSQGLFFTKDRSRFRILKESEGNFYGCSSEAVGEFLGYPERSVLYYANSGRTGMDTIREIKREYSDHDLEYLTLLGYIPAPEEKQVKLGVERGKEISQRMDEFAEKGFPTCKQLKDRLLEKTRWDS